jgi:hypothetical protein
MRPSLPPEPAHRNIKAVDPAEFAEIAKIVEAIVKPAVIVRITLAS